MTAADHLSKKQTGVIRKQRKRFLKRAVRRRYIVGRSLCMILFFCIILYMTAIFCSKDRLFKVQEDYSFEYGNAEPREDNPVTELYGLIIRLKSGELEFYHSRSKSEEIYY